MSRLQRPLDLDRVVFVGGTVDAWRLCTFRLRSRAADVAQPEYAGRDSKARQGSEHGRDGPGRVHGMHQRAKGGSFPDHPLATRGDQNMVGYAPDLAALLYLLNDWVPEDASTPPENGAIKVIPPCRVGQAALGYSVGCGTVVVCAPATTQFPPSRRIDRPRRRMRACPPIAANPWRSCGLAGRRAAPPAAQG